MENLQIIAGVVLMVGGLGWLAWIVWTRDPFAGDVEEDFTATYLSDHPNKDRSWQ